MNAGAAAGGRRLRFLAVASLLAIAAFYAGAHLFTTRPSPPVHPLTGRQIAGIATDTSWLDRATREREEAPEQALQLIGIRPGMVVADVGAGTGYMTTRLARLVGPTGRYANDARGCCEIIQTRPEAASGKR
jgi:predicted methyltransferase